MASLIGKLEVGDNEAGYIQPALFVIIKNNYNPEDPDEINIASWFEEEFKNDSPEQVYKITIEKDF